MRRCHGSTKLAKVFDELGPSCKLWRATLSLSPGAGPPLAREIDEPADHDKLWRAMLSLSPGCVKLAKEIEESAVTAVISSGLPSYLKTFFSVIALGAKTPRGVLSSPASWSSQNPFRNEILKETFVLMDVWRAERRCHGHGVRCQLW